MRNVARLVMALLLLVVLGSGCLWLYLNWQHATSGRPVTVSAGLDQLWSTTLTDAEGRAYALQQYQGRPLVLNFWATWCEPCRDEMPEISALAEAYPRVAVLGLAIDEAAAVHEFVASTPVAYPLLLAESEGMLLAEALGNDKGALPYTVIISPQGKVTHTFFGRVNRQMLQKALNLPV